MKEIRRIPLLTPEQEVQYAQRVARLTALDGLRAALSTTLERQPTTLEWAAEAGLEETELRRLTTSGQAAKKRMIEANLRLVVKIANKYTNQGLELPDLVQEGAIGLQRGIEKFDPAKGYRLSTYAYWWIRQAITRTIAQKSRAIRLPVHIATTLNQAKKVERELSEELKRKPTIEEVAARVKLAPQKLHDLLECSKKAVSLNRQMSRDDDGCEVIDLMEYKTPDPQELIDLEYARGLLVKAMASLPARSQKILALYYGLDGREPMTTREVGELIGLTRTRIGTLKRAALATLANRKALLAPCLGPD